MPCYFFRLPRRLVLPCFSGLVGTKPGFASAPDGTDFGGVFFVTLMVFWLVAMEPPIRKGQGISPPAPRLPATPRHAMPNRTQPCPTLARHALPAMPNRAVPNRTLSDLTGQTRPIHALPNRTLSDRTGQTRPDHAQQCPTLPRHALPASPDLAAPCQTLPHQCPEDTGIVYQTPVSPRIPA